MKKTFLILALIFFATNLFAQGSLEEFRSYVQSKDYLKAEELVDKVIQENKDNPQAYLEAGDLLMELEKHEKALSLFDEANKRDRRNPDIFNRMGTANSYLGNHDVAIELFEKSLERDDEKFMTYIEYAEAFLRAGKLKEAEIKIQQAQDIDKKNPLAFIALGDLYFEQRVYALARENYEKALEINPDLLDAKMKLATSYYWLANREADRELGNELFSRSLEQWNQITKMDPKNARAFYQQGKILFFSKQYDKAALSFNNYVQLRPDGSLGRWYLAQALYEVGRCDSAAPHLQKVSVEIDSVTEKSKLLLARCYMDNKDYVKAADTYATLDTEMELDLADKRRFGQAQFFSGDTTQALATFKEAIAMDPSDPGNCKLMMFMGQITVAAKMYDEAITVLNQRLSTEGCDMDDAQNIHYLLGQSYLFTEQNDKAIESFSNAIAIDSMMYYAHVFLGDAYAASGDIENAEKEFNFVINNADTSDQRSVSAMVTAFAKESGLLLENKDFNELNGLTKKWIEVMPDNKYGLLYHAVSWQGLGDKPKACEYYNKVLKVDPENSTAAQNLQALGC